MAAFRMQTTAMTSPRVHSAPGQGNRSDAALNRRQGAEGSGIVLHRMAAAPAPSARRPHQRAGPVNAQTRDTASPVKCEMRTATRGVRPAGQWPAQTPLLSFDPIAIPPPRLRRPQARSRIKARLRYKDANPSSSAAITAAASASVSTSGGERITFGPEIRTIAPAA